MARDVITSLIEEAERGSIGFRRAADIRQEDVAKRFKGTGVIGTYLFHSRRAAISACSPSFISPFGIDQAPARSSRIYQQDLQLAAGLTIHQDAGTSLTAS